MICCSLVSVEKSWVTVAGIVSLVAFGNMWQAPRIAAASVVLVPEAVVVMAVVRVFREAIKLLSSSQANSLRLAETTVIYGIGGLSMMWTLQRLDAFMN